MILAVDTSFDRSAPVRTGLNVDTEYRFQALRPSHRGTGYPSVRNCRVSKSANGAARLPAFLMTL
jgi:hypothetical protein